MQIDNQMLTANQIVTQFPLETLWTDNENLQAKRQKYLGKQSIKEILNRSPVEFVVASIGSKLKWIALEKCYVFWKSEVQTHLADDSGQINLDSFPNNYAYIASQWTSLVTLPLILLEKIH